MLRKISDEEIHNLSLKAATVIVFTLTLAACAVFGALVIRIALTIIMGW